MSRFTCLAVALVVVGCAKSKSADRTVAEPGGASGGAVASGSAAASPETTTIEDTAAHTPLPKDDLTPKGGNDEQGKATATAVQQDKATESKPKDGKELGRSNAALGTTDHGELFEQLAVKVESAKLGTKASTELSTAVTGKTTDLDACYATAKKANAKLAGSIELVFLVDADGNVTSVVVKSSTVKNKELETCVKGVAKLVKLEKSLLTTKSTKASVVIAFGS